MIKTIQIISLVTNLVVLFIIGKVFDNTYYVLGFVLGAIASNINFYINYKYTNLFQNQSIFESPLSNPTVNYVVRIMIYALVLTLVFKSMNEIVAIFTTLGCSSIRIAILVYGIYSKGGDNSANN